MTRRTAKRKIKAKPTETKKTSLPSRIAGIQLAWISVGLDSPTVAHCETSQSLKPSSVKELMLFGILIMLSTERIDKLIANLW